MWHRGPWMLMLHGKAFIEDMQQSGPRGYDKFFSTNWIMPMAQRKLGNGTLTIRSMFSLEPATITGGWYPELFQVGETASRRAIIDGQHPHDFIMELAANYEHRVGENTSVSIYGGPVGAPALGPVAYPHRESARENPIATLGHHMQDSSHIANTVVTVGASHRAVRLELSGFHGREPDESRWDIDGGAIDSWSTRLTLRPAANWSGQFSIGRLNSPEVLHAADDVLRTTASVMYNRPLARGSWATSAIWGRNLTLPEHARLNSYLLESTLTFGDANNVWVRLENADRTDELLLGSAAPLPGSHEHFIGRVQAFTAGYDREIPLLPGVSSAVGGQITGYAVPDPLQPSYGSHPVSALVFLRFRARGSQHH